MDEATPLLPPPDRQLSAGNRILVFSRESDTRFLIKTILEIWGYQTVESGCVEKSLLLVENWKPNLILVDFVLPFGTHLDYIRQIRDNRLSKEIPIIVLSGFSYPKFCNLSQEIGADDFFVKPVDFDLLEICLKRKFDNSLKQTH
jgi:two-component system phosphate regulon response regulator PhoB